MITKSQRILVSVVLSLTPIVGQVLQNDIDNITALYNAGTISRQEMIRGKFGLLVGRRKTTVMTRSAESPGTTEFTNFTSVIREVNIDLNFLEDSDQELFLDLFDRPTDHPGGVVVGGNTYEFDPNATILTWESSNNHFIAHYTVDATNDPTHAIPAGYQTDSDDHGQGNGVFNANNAPDIVERYAAVAEQAYDLYVTQMGFIAPVDDGDARYDIYVMDLPQFVGGFVSNAGETRTGNPYFWSYTSFMCVRNGVSDAQTPDLSPDKTIAHELHHAIQYSYNAAVDYQLPSLAGGFYEQSSRWAEYKAYPAVTDWQVDANDYLRETSRTDQTGTDFPIYWEHYDGCLWPIFLDEYHNTPAIIVQIWEALGADGNSTPPYYTMSSIEWIGDVLSTNYGETLEDNFLQFSTWNAFTGGYRDGNHYDFSGLDGLYSLNLANVPHSHTNVGSGANVRGTTVFGASDLEVPSLSNDYAFIDLDNTITNAVEITFDGHDTPDWKVRLLAFEGNTNTLIADLYIDPTDKTGKVTVFNAEALRDQRLILQMTNTTYHRPYTDKYAYDYTIIHRSSVQLHEVSDQVGDIVIYQGTFDLAGDFKIHDNNTLYFVNGATVNLNDYYMTGQSQDLAPGATEPYTSKDYPIEGTISGAEDVMLNPEILLRVGERDPLSEIAGLYPSLDRVGIVDGKPGIHGGMTVTLGQGEYSMEGLGFADQSLMGEGAGVTTLTITANPGIAIDLENDIGMRWANFTIRDGRTGKPDDWHCLRFGSDESNSVFENIEFIGEDYTGIGLEIDNRGHLPGENLLVQNVVVRGFKIGIDNVTSTATEMASNDLSDNTIPENFRVSSNPLEYHANNNYGTYKNVISIAGDFEDLQFVNNNSMGGNIGVNPQWVNPAEDDLRLQAISPLIDAGTDGFSDIGARQYNTVFLVAAFVNPEVVDKYGNRINATQNDFGDGAVIDEFMDEDVRPVKRITVRKFIPGENAFTVSISRDLNEFLPKDLDPTHVIAEVSVNDLQLKTFTFSALPETGHSSKNINVDVTPPAAPRDFEAKIVDVDVVLSWQANAEPDLAGYLIYRSESLPVEFSASNQIASLGTEQMTFTDVGAAEASKAYAVVSMDVAGNYSVRKEAYSALFLYVDDNGSNETGNGSFSMPFRTIQYTYNQIPSPAKNNFVISLLPGLYEEPTEIIMHKENQFSLDAGLSIKSAFDDFDSMPTITLYTYCDDDDDDDDDVDGSGGDDEDWEEDDVEDNGGEGRAIFSIQDIGSNVTFEGLQFLGGSCIRHAISLRQSPGKNCGAISLGRCYFFADGTHRFSGAGLNNRACSNVTVENSVFFGLRDAAIALKSVGNDPVVRNMRIINNTVQECGRFLRIFSSSNRQHIDAAATLIANNILNNIKQIAFQGHHEQPPIGVQNCLFNNLRKGVKNRHDQFVFVDTLVRNPMFENCSPIGFSDRTSNLWFLTGESPAINNGASVPSSAFDFYLNPRVQDGVIDIGAVEGPREGPVISVITMTPVPIPKQPTLLLKGPNPFKSSALIGYVIPRLNNDRTSFSGLSKSAKNTLRASGLMPVVLYIYDVKGRKVRTLVDDYRAPGSYSVVWDVKSNKGQPISAGMYICYMRVGSRVASMNMFFAK